MRTKTFWFSAAVMLLTIGNAAADPFRQRVQSEPGRAWGIDAGGLYLEEASTPRRAVALPGWQWLGRPYSAPAIAIGPRGDVVVTSNVLPVLWRIDARSLEVSVHSLELDADTDKDAGFSELVYSERDAAYFAFSELTRTLWRIDPLLRRAQKIAVLSGGAR